MRTILVTSALVLLAPTFAATQVRCGDTIGKGETVTLTADLGPCDGVDPTNLIGLGFALQVRGGTLDLGGHTVTCADTDGDGLTPVGIMLRREQSRVINGTVVGCYWGLTIGDDLSGEVIKYGRHRVEHLTVQNSLADGVIVANARCTLIDVTSTNSLQHGFVIGDRSKLVDLVASGNGYSGFYIPSSGNKMRGLRATGNARNGIAIRGERNTLRGATATGNAADGLALYLFQTNNVDYVNNNKLTDCEGSGNGGSGIAIHGHANTVKNSIALGNTINGFTIWSPRNLIKGGSALGNGGFDLLNCYGSKVSNLDHTTESSNCP